MQSAFATTQQNQNKTIINAARVQNVVATRIAGGKVRWQGTQRVIGSRSGTHGKDEPRMLNRAAWGAHAVGRLLKQAGVDVSDDERMGVSVATNPQAGLGALPRGDMPGPRALMPGGAGPPARLYTRFLPRLAATPAHVSMEDVRTSNRLREREW